MSQHGPGRPPAGAPPYRVPAPPPRDSWRGPTRVEPLPGTTFALGYLSVPPAVSGMAVGSLVVGIASLLVTTLVACFGFSGARAGWGGWVAGAFAVLAGLLGLAGVALGAASLRQIRRGAAPGAAEADRRTGRGLAVSGLSCGATGAGLTVLVLGSVLAVQFG